MATRTKKKIETEITAVTKPKAVFKNELSERIIEGEEIIAERIENDNDFINAKQLFSEWTDYNMELLKQSFNNPYNEYQNSYKGAGNLIGFTITKNQRSHPGQQLSQFIAKVKAKIDNLIKLKNKADLLKYQIDEDEITPVSTNNLNMSQVFIVHGHDGEAKTKTARFIEKLGFEAIILHEKASSSKTIIEKIEEYSNVGFGIILYTPCDIGGKNEKHPELKSRARQNVIFEHGFLIGKIGRSNVCALVKGDIEIPNDISGVIYEKMDNSDSWMYKVGKEMKKIGYKIDMNKI